MRIVDNSQLAQDGMAYRRMPKIIHVYNKTGVGTLGDKILLAIKGQKQKAIIVGCVNKVRKPNIPSYETNNCVLIDNEGNPLGTRVTAPIPASLRSRESCAKVVAIATRFI
jgi:large subunit ribosomal protein L14